MTSKRDLTTDILRLRWLIAAEQLELLLARAAPPTQRLRTKCSQLQASLAFRRMQLAYARNLVALGKAGFNPAQPRVPAGHPDGGQWTRDGTVPARVRLADASPVISPGPVMSDASPDPIRPGAQYAAGPTQITIHPSALTGISTIDDTTKRLVSTLATVMDTVDYLPGLRPQEYGKLVHYAFAAAVRAGNFPGIGFFDVETTFGPDLDAHYGSKGSIRTDVVLRNEVGDIMAIYDVKTGDAIIDQRRAAQLRAKTGVGPRVPIIELHVLRGVTLKGRLSISEGWISQAIIYW